MDVSLSAQTSNTSGSNIYIDRSVYKAAICPRQKVDTSELQANLSRLTVGGRNTVLHLASAAGNLEFIQQILHLKPEHEFLEAGNVNGNTALHEAAHSGHCNVVAELLPHRKGLVNMHNNIKQSPLFKACEGGHLEIVKKLLKESESKLLDKSLDGRTCLHVVVSRGDADLLNYLLTYIDENWGREGKDLLKETDRQGDTVLHLAARTNRLDMVNRLLAFEPDLCYSPNLDAETAVCVAVKLGFLAIVEALVNCSPESIEIPTKKGKNILHLAVELSQVKILNFLVEKVDLSQLINQPDEAPAKDKLELSHDKILKFPVEKLKLSQHITHPSEGAPKDDTDGQEDGNQSGGDTPLHIAARSKNVYTVDLLLKVRGVNKGAVNSAGLTPLDIARKNTEYLDSFKIIGKLSTHPRRRWPFLYNAPTMSQLKQKKAVDIVDRVYAERRNAELVVAVLLATMTFTAITTLPGGFHVEQKDDSDSNPSGSSRPGMSVPIHFDPFKLFLIFDCVGFYLSLFVVLMWEMSTPLTTGDKMLFMCMTSAVLCTAFAFTAYGLMVEVYVLAYQVQRFAWIVLGSSMFIAFCGTCAFFYVAAKFMVMRARFHRLCGVPRLLDNITENIWGRAEKHGILGVVRPCEDFVPGLRWGIYKASKEERPLESCGGDKKPVNDMPTFV